jgi:hypothetical protein
MMRYVPPRLACNDVANAGIRYAESARERLLSLTLSRARSDFNDILIGQLGGRLVLPMRESLRVDVRAMRFCRAGESRHPSLLASIARVGSVRSEKQVTRTDTGRVVTVVANEQAPRINSMSHAVRDAMGAAGHATTNADLTVPLAVSRTSPNPTGAKFRTMGRNGAVLVDLRPEPLSNRGATIYTHREPSSPGARPRSCCEQAGVSSRQLYQECRCRLAYSVKREAAA